MARHGNGQTAQTDLADPAQREIVGERHVAQAEVIGLLHVDIRNARVVAVAAVGVVGSQAGELGVVAGLLPCIQGIVDQIPVAVAHRGLEAARILVVVDRMSQRIVEVDRKGQVLEFEGIVHTARRMGHDIAQQEHVLGRRP